MRAAWISDVGDGLSMSLVGVNNALHVDCGGSDHWIAAKSLIMASHIFRVSKFILSHFHLDHYGGLLTLAYTWRLPRLLNIDHVYYPGIPAIIYDGKDISRDFLTDICALNARTFGSITGVMEYDFLKCLRRLNRKQFKYRKVSKGDTIRFDANQIEVLWPPPTIDSKDIVNKVRKGIDDFNRAMEQDSALRQIYERIKRREDLFTESDDELINLRVEPREMPEMTVRANESLKDAANDLSVIFSVRDELIFFGDAEEYEIRETVNHLDTKNKLKFTLLITPHHGSHWHDSLYKMNFVFSLSSNGQNNVRHFKREFMEVSDLSLATFENGNIFVSLSGRLVCIGTIPFISYH